MYTCRNQLQIKFLFTALLMMAVGSMVIDSSPSNMMMNNNNNNMMYQIRHRGQHTPRSLLVSSHSRPSFKPIQKTHFVRSPFTNNQVSAVAVFPSRVFSRGVQTKKMFQLVSQCHYPTFCPLIPKLCSAESESGGK